MAAYHVDIVLCIDGTGSMKDTIAHVKAAALTFHDQLLACIRYGQDDIAKLRLKVIVFRDYWAGDSDPMLISAFYESDQLAEFDGFVRAIEAGGGASPEENSLEAIAYAIKSEWTRDGEKRRHLIVLWTDDAAHPLEKRQKESPPETYPLSEMPGSLDELLEWWTDHSRIDQRAKRMLIFAPTNRYPWSDLDQNRWPEMIIESTLPGQGLTDRRFSDLLEAIGKSVA